MTTLQNMVGRQHIEQYPSEAENSREEGIGFLPVLLLTLAIGVGCGLANGVLITLGRITPFVVTLGMMSIGGQ